MGLPVAAVLFDLDGTLMDHETAAVRAVVECRPDADPAFVERRWVELTDEYVERFAAGEMSFAEQRRRRAVLLAAELGRPGWDDAAAGLTGVWLDRPGTGAAADVPRIGTLAELPGLLG
ncbi:HAD family hydrolase [Actinomadura oligospora]|uniref:HAD family hydrolase n=1 Tax=Actinomadura oligospora TaxID=111804 RepID=UPI00047A3BF3|nr:HAD family hydrolase [Actinomadura oligospora]